MTGFVDLMIFGFWVLVDFLVLFGFVVEWHRPNFAGLMFFVNAWIGLSFGVCCLDVDFACG